MGGKKKNKNKAPKDLKDVNDAIQENLDEQKPENESPKAENETKPAAEEKKEEIIEPKFEEAPS